jgi:arginine decarboxylase
MSTITNGRSTPTAPSTSSTRAWSVQDAAELYEVARWGHGYFSVNSAGHVQVQPTKDPAHAIDR